MARPHAAAIVEDALNRRLAESLESRGWQTKVLPYTGYGGAGFVRVLGRVLFSRGQDVELGTPAPEAERALRDADEELRGWKAFITTPVVEEPVTIRVQGREIHATTDRSGLIDVTVRGHGLAPGWHTVELSSPRAAKTAEAPVLIVGTTQTFGIISDIDDTVLATSLPRPLLAAWNTFVRIEGARHAVPGMATMYRELLADHPDAPVIYVSTGAWNTAPWLARFLRRKGFPRGPMLLTDWGPTNSGWFRSGPDHKRACLHRLARELPHITWLLVGDDGQRDPRLYAEFAEAKPDRVAAIALRELSASEQVLAGGVPVPTGDSAAAAEAVPVPVCRAHDGYELGRRVRQALAQRVSRPAPSARSVTGARTVEDAEGFGGLEDALGGGTSGNSLPGWSDA